MLQVEEMHDDLERRLEEAEKEEGKQVRLGKERDATATRLILILGGLVVM